MTSSIPDVLIILILIACFLAIAEGVPKHSRRGKRKD